MIRLLMERFDALPLPIAALYAVAALVVLLALYGATMDALFGRVVRTRADDLADSTDDLAAFRARLAQRRAQTSHGDAA